MTNDILHSSSVAEAAFDLDSACGQLFTPPKSLAKGDIAAVLSTCAAKDIPASETQAEKSDGEDSDSIGEDDIDGNPEENVASPQLLTGPITPVVEGLTDPEETKRLANMYMARMANKGQTQADPGDNERNRQAFLSLPRHHWILSRVKRQTCFHAVGCIRGIVAPALHS